MPTTIKFFRRQVSEFRAQMGQRAFWDNPGRHHAITALTHVLHRLHRVNEAVRGGAADLLAAAVDEYKRREALYLSGKRAVDPLPPPVLGGDVVRPGAGRSEEAQKES